MIKQPIFVIEKGRVVHWLEHQSKFTEIPYSLDWGDLKSAEEFVNVLNAHVIDGDYIRMSNLYDIIEKFKTPKMLGGANRMLNRVYAICKKERKDLNKISEND